MNHLTVMNFNASRTRNLGKIENFLQFLGNYDPCIVNIQEINVQSALKIFSRKFQVIINIDMEAKDGVGIVTLIKKGVKILDSIIGKSGRIIKIKLKKYANMECIPQVGVFI